MTLLVLFVTLLYLYMANYTTLRRGSSKHVEFVFLIVYFAAVS